MNWNPVLKKCLEIKKEYEKRFGVIVEYETDEQFKESKTCLERWVSELNRIETCEKYQEYETIVSFLLLTQHKNFLLVKYGRYNDIYGQDNRTIEDFWNCYDGFYRECRSVVIDLEKECIVLAPFAKFFNINELEETNLENVQKRISKAKNVEFSDKLDGSMQSARWYDGRIVMAGSQALDPKASWRLQDGYRMINSLPGYGELLRKYNKYMLMTCLFRIVSKKWMDLTRKIHIITWI